MKKETKQAIAIIALLFVLFCIKPLTISKEQKDLTVSHFEPLEEPVKASSTVEVKGVVHRITCYLWTGNKMANGQYPKEGYVATSDRTIPFNTEIEIDGVTYLVGDRTNKRFKEFKIPTIDIFFEGSREDCLKLGVKYKEVIIN